MTRKGGARCCCINMMVNEEDDEEVMEEAQEEERCALFPVVQECLDRVNTMNGPLADFFLCSAMFVSPVPDLLLFAGLRSRAAV